MKPARAEFIFVIAAAFGAFIQGTGAFAAFGVQPNLALAILAALAFCVRSLFTFVLATGAAAAVLSASGAGLRELAALALITFAAFVFGVRLPGKTFVNSAALAVSGTFIFYAIADAAFLGQEIGRAAAEAVANGVLAAAFLGVFRFLFSDAYAQKIRTPF